MIPSPSQYFWISLTRWRKTFNSVEVSLENVLLELLGLDRSLAFEGFFQTDDWLISGVDIALVFFFSLSSHSPHEGMVSWCSHKGHSCVRKVSPSFYDSVCLPDWMRSPFIRFLLEMADADPPFSVHQSSWYRLHLFAYHFLIFHFFFSKLD